VHAVSHAQAGPLLSGRDGVRLPGAAMLSESQLAAGLHHCSSVLR